MISKEDWEEAYRHLIADGRKRLGPPPTFEDADALSRGELSEGEAERVRELFSVYPDLLRVLTEPPPTNAEGVLTDAELLADLEMLREHARSAKPVPVVSLPLRRSPQRTSSLGWTIAAGVIIAIAVGIVAVRRTTSEPRLVLTQLLYPETQRRGGPSQPAITLSKEADYSLQLVFSSRRQYREYRLELLEVATHPPRKIWLRDDVSQRPDGTFLTRLSTEALDPGLYRLVLYGGDETVEPVAQYSIRLSAR